ncbi:conserved hypothetical protein [Frankia sp. AiPs1]|uniref:hypothetical protein n=1 Tax=Frankia sp. AiPa1 TaxID=573492 RepID=UPI00202AF819|nr:hypothetical protein [Frankia sp. AiPa1]MCL9758793.1 hypothetical protein [Frankia sp. AiPa1]
MTLAVIVLLCVWGILANLTVALVLLSKITDDRRDIADWQRTQDIINARRNP